MPRVVVPQRVCLTDAQWAQSVPMLPQGKACHAPIAGCP